MNFKIFEPPASSNLTTTASFDVLVAVMMVFVRRAMHCFSCCFRIRDDNHTQVNRFSQPIPAVRKETVDPLASSCVWSILAHEGLMLS
ncbi:hypothetical protein Hanom_Chr16g01440961 [Helianthus anomalus]